MGKPTGFLEYARQGNHCQPPLERVAYWNEFHPRLGREERLALLLGTEGDGLAADTIARCDHTVPIPMGHGVDSLNEAAASAAAFWQLRAAPVS